MNMQQDFTKLPEIYRPRNSTSRSFKLQHRGEKAVMYQATHMPRCFEVFVIRKRPSRVIGGVTIPACEPYPSDEDFGTWAWSFSTYELALRKYEELENKQA